MYYSDEAKLQFSRFLCVSDMALLGIYGKLCAEIILLSDNILHYRKTNKVN